MWLIYIDDSGDPGLKVRDKSPTDAFVLSALAVKEEDWLDTLDQIISFRRFVRDNFGLRMRDELKASYLIHGTGPFSSLGTSDRARMRIYRMAMRLQTKLNSVTTWAIVIRKKEAEESGRVTSSQGVFELAWRQMIQRVERFTYYQKDHAIIFPDEGYAQFVRTTVRGMRRFSTVSRIGGAGEPLQREAVLLLEDPNFRSSHESYFIQLADLNAYAAHRRMYPQSYFGGEYWERLESARNEAVSRLIRKREPSIPIGIAPYPYP